MSAFYAVLSGGRTKHHPLRAANAKTRVVNAHDGTFSFFDVCSIQYAHIGI